MTSFTYDGVDYEITDPTNNYVKMILTPGTYYENMTLYNVIKNSNISYQITEIELAAGVSTAKLLCQWTNTKTWQTITVPVGCSVYKFNDAVSIPTLSGPGAAAVIDFGQNHVFQYDQAGYQVTDAVNKYVTMTILTTDKYLLNGAPTPLYFQVQDDSISYNITQIQFQSGLTSAKVIAEFSTQEWQTITIPPECQIYKYSDSLTFPAQAVDSTFNHIAIDGDKFIQSSLIFPTYEQFQFQSAFGNYNKCNFIVQELSKTGIIQQVIDDQPKFIKCWLQYQSSSQDIQLRMIQKIYLDTTWKVQLSGGVVQELSVSGGYYLADNFICDQPLDSNTPSISLNLSLMQTCQIRSLQNLTAPQIINLTFGNTQVISLTDNQVNSSQITINLPLLNNGSAILFEITSLNTNQLTINRVSNDNTIVTVQLDDCILQKDGLNINLMGENDMLNILKVNIDGVQFIQQMDSVYNQLIYQDNKLIPILNKTTTPSSTNTPIKFNAIINNNPDFVSNTLITASQYIGGVW